VRLPLAALPLFICLQAWCATALQDRASCVLENQSLKVTIDPVAGTFSVLDKAAGYLWKGPDAIPSSGPPLAVPRGVGPRTLDDTRPWAPGGKIAITPAMLAEGAKPDSAADCSADAAVEWTADGLALLITVRDDKPVFGDGTEDRWWDKDSVEFWLNDRQYGVRLGDFGAKMWASGGDPSGIKPTFERTEGGYKLLLSIPASYLGDATKRGPGAQFRFALGINDADDAAGRQTQLYYPQGWRHSTPETFATAVLAEANGQIPAAKPAPAAQWEYVPAEGVAAAFKVVLRTSGKDFPATLTFRLLGEGPDLQIAVDADPDTPIGNFQILHPLVLDRPGGRILAAAYCDGIGVPTDDMSWAGRTWSTYGSLDMPWVGLTDGTLGYMLLWELPTSCDNGTARLDRVTVGDKTLLAPSVRHDPIMGKFGAQRVVRYSFTQGGGHVSICKRFRDYVKANGLLVTQREKMAKTPQLALLAGAPDIWGRNDLKFCKEAKAAGMDRLFVNGPTAPADMLAIRDLGFLCSKYDNYEDYYEGRENSVYGDGHGNDEVVVNADGSYMKAWLSLGPPPVQAMKRCTYFYPQVARKWTAEDLAKYPYNARFLDVTTASGLRECYAPAHKLNRTEDREVKRELARLMVDEFKLVLGGEHGRWWGADIYNYWEGMQSGGFYSWPAGYVGREIPQTRDAIGQRYLDWGLGEKNRYPLWELVYHDCTVSTWYWGDSTGHLYTAAPDLAYKQDAFNVLYGTPPLYWTNRPYSFKWDDPKLRERLLESYRNTCKLHEAIGFEEMVGHEFVTEDRAVQHTTFADGTNVWVNFGETPYSLKLGDQTWVLPQYGYYAKGPKIEQFRADLTWDAKDYKGIDEAAKQIGGIGARQPGQPVTCLRADGYVYVAGDCPGLVESFLGFPVLVRRDGPARMTVSSDAKWARVNWRAICPEAGEGDWRMVQLDPDGKPARLGETVQIQDGMLLLPPGFPVGTVQLVGPAEIKAMTEVSLEVASKAPEKPKQGEPLTFKLKVANQGGKDAGKVTVTAYEGPRGNNVKRGEVTLGSLAAGGTAEVQFTFPSDRHDGLTVFNFAAEAAGVQEMCTADNVVESGLRVEPDWSKWDSFADVTVNAGGLTRRNAIVEVPFDLDAERARLGKAGAGDPASVRVVRLDTDLQWPKNAYPAQYVDGAPAERKVVWQLWGELPAGGAARFRIYFDGKEAARHAASTDTVWMPDRQAYYGQNYIVRFRDGSIQGLDVRVGGGPSPALNSMIVSSGDTGWSQEGGEVKSFEVVQDGPVFTQIRVKRDMPKGHSYDKLFTLYRDHMVITVLSPERFGVFNRAHMAVPCKFEDDRGNKADVDGKGDGEDVSGKNPAPKWYAAWNDLWAMSCIAVTPHNGLTYWDSGSNMAAVGFTGSDKNPQTQAFYFHDAKNRAEGDTSLVAPDFAAEDYKQATTPLSVTR
jgi:hypothetical protein